ncbi:MAG: hypothetical protein Athens101428_478 [Candidatus Berkelbacteria bacterium Athens1014_28]|uniref:Uncharacterized protein n=1 Tax=Candidatus Berkelbacteria bacterium Athens1014_28 TaxID=2017145 RepID=A0A554LM35_9BACT|nr:MAG: hypothetical protein Athens101428_478 [Candidatus Berkelbacteria bacterium Athens1014_28]
MIKKNTKMVFEDGNFIEELVGGVPLSEGEVVNVKKNEEVVKYTVVKKTVDFIFEGNDQTANIIYLLKKI